MSSKTLKGTVVSTKMNKTAVVTVNVPKKHSIYGKRFVKYNKFKVHDEENMLKEGDVVVIVESKPISKSKTWVLKEVVKDIEK